VPSLSLAVVLIVRVILFSLFWLVSFWPIKGSRLRFYHPPRLSGATPKVIPRHRATIVEHCKVPLDPTPVESVTAVFYSFSVDESAVSVCTKLERYDTEALVAKISEMLCAGTCCRACIDSHKRDAWHFRVVHNDHR